MKGLFELAAQNARAEFGQGFTQPHVVVTVPIGYSSFVRATADEFTAGVLTITSLDTQDPIREFQPWEWLRATAYAGTGYPEFAFVNPFGDMAQSRSDALLKSAMDASREAQERKAS